MNKIFIGLISTVILLVLALVFLNKQIKPTVQDPVVTNKQGVQQNRLPELSEITGKTPESGQSGLMPLPSSQTAGGDKEENGTVVSIDGEASEKLPPLEDYVLVPIAKQNKDIKTDPAQAGDGKASKEPAKAAAADAAPKDKDPVASAETWQQHSDAAATDSLLRSATIGSVPAPALKSERQPAAAKTADKNEGGEAAGKPAAEASTPAPAAPAAPADKAEQPKAENPGVSAAAAAANANAQAAAGQDAAKQTAEKQPTANKDAASEADGSAKTMALTPPQKNKKTDAKSEQAEKAAASADKAAEKSAAKAAKADEKKKADAERKNDKKAAGGQPKITILNRDGGATVRISMGRQISYKQLLLTNPDRLVIDITGEYKDLRAPGIPSNNFVNNIRLGHYDNRTRIVFDLKETPAKHRFIVSKDKNRLDVRLDK